MVSVLKREGEEEKVSLTSLGSDCDQRPDSPDRASGILLLTESEIVQHAREAVDLKRMRRRKDQQKKNDESTVSSNERSSHVRIESF